MTYFTYRGPVPAMKVDLRCRDCNLTFSYAQYGNSVDGFQHYEQLRSAAESSNVVYVERVVMEQFSALRYVYKFPLISVDITKLYALYYSHHAWVSFSTFCEAYNESVQQHDSWEQGPVGTYRHKLLEQLAEAVSRGK